MLAPNPTRPSQASRSVRVDVAQLDALMNLVGELVLTRNEMVEYSAVQQNPVLLESSQRLNAITTQLQAGIMKTRMQPIENVWSTFPRSCATSPLACGKQVRLELDGQDTELDKTLLEAIKDPLTHVVRNCVDHGIETAEQRLLAGKPLRAVSRSAPSTRAARSTSRFPTTGGRGCRARSGERPSSAVSSPRSRPPR